MKIWAELPRLAPSDAATHQMVRGPSGGTAKPHCAGICGETKYHRNSMLSQIAALWQVCPVILMYLMAGRFHKHIGPAWVRSSNNAQCSRRLRPLLVSTFLLGLLWELLGCTGAPPGCIGPNGWSQRKPLRNEGCLSTLFTLPTPKVAARPPTHASNDNKSNFKTMVCKRSRYWKPG